jgi:hypothetical protein
MARSARALGAQAQKHGPLPLAQPGRYPNACSSRTSLLRHTKMILRPLRLAMSRHAAIIPGHQANAAAVLADASRQVLIGRQELAEPRAGVAALTPGEVGGEVFDMDLDPRPVGGELVQGHAPFLPGQDGLIAVGGERDLDDMLALLARLHGQQQQQPSADRKLPRMRVAGRALLVI